MGRREAAAFMGHEVKTHDKHYGSWIDEDGLREAHRRHAGVSASAATCSSMGLP
jgi:hypothetical protein